MADNQPLPTICSGCNGTSGKCVSPLVPLPGCRRDKIRQIYLANGFGIKTGRDDLQDRFYNAAEALLEAFNAPNGAD